jgi:glucose/arabinose dehydrogenase
MLTWTRTRTTTLLAVGALALGGCASADADPAATSAAPTADPTTAAEPSAPTTGTGDVAADLPTEVLLPDSAWDADPAQRQESAGVVDWRFPTSCDAGAPDTATAMRTVSQGDGAAEATIGVQQVAVFADADAAVAEADRLVAALTACTTYASDTSTTYVVEPLDVGAQGTGLATDYYGSSASAPLDEAIGSYLALTRRGTAVTLVGSEGGESVVGTARVDATTQAQAAWELLCRYDEAGC